MKKLNFESILFGLISRGTSLSCLQGQLTDAVLEPHGDDAALVSLVHPRAVPELRDPALGRPVRRPRVHQPVHQQQADHRVRVPFHHLEGNHVIIRHCGACVMRSQSYFFTVAHAQCATNQNPLFSFAPV